MNSSLSVFLLGPFRAERAGERLTAFKSNKVRGLLTYLAVERQQPHHRKKLAGLLWPESSDSSALALLRDALSNLRALLGDRTNDTPYIEVVQNTLQFRLHSAGWLDIAAFTAATAPDTGVKALNRAIRLYRGEFLEGFSLSGTHEFEAWLLHQRERYHRTTQQALYRLTTHYLQDRDYPAAQGTARRQLVLEPYDEDAHRQLLRALALDGKRNQALAHYNEYRAQLEDEMNVKPDIRTTALHQRIRDRRLTPTRTAGYPISSETPITPMSDTWPFVGRQAELMRLDDALKQAQLGRGQVLMISGEAGSGKTRLIQAFIHQYVSKAEGTVAAWGAGNGQVSDGDPYLPFREMLRLLTGDFDVPILRSNLTPELAQRLEALTPTVSAALEQFGPDLLGDLPLTDRGSTPPNQPTPPRPAAMCDRMGRLFNAVARRCTLVLVLEDLHWTDDSTLNLLAHLGQRIHHAPILLIGSYRPGDAQSSLTQTIRELERRWGDIIIDLDRASGRAFIDAVLDSMPNALGPTFREQLYRQTGGHALFTMSLIEQLQTDGSLSRSEGGRWTAHADLDWHYLPTRVEAVISRRIDSLPENLQQLLTVASVEGEIFTAEVIAQVTDQPSKTVQKMLSGPLRARQLIDAQGLKKVGDQRVARYRFHHILFQQYLYGQLGPVERARYHETVGKALEKYYGEQPRAAARLAHHFENADLTEQAVCYLTKAGAYAYQLSAPAEAIKLYRRGLMLLKSLPESAARDQQELALQMGLNIPLFAAQGWGAPERDAALQRAHTLARRLNTKPDQLSILRALADVNTAQAKHQASLAYAEQLSRLSRQVDDPAYEMLSYRMMGISSFFLGDYQKARTHLERGIRFYETLSRASDPSLLPDVEETAFMWAWLPLILAILGYPEEAAACSCEALSRIRNDGHAHAQAKMLTVAGTTLYATLRRPKEALEYANELLRLAETHHLPAFRGWAVFYQGWAHAALGDPEKGLDEMNDGWEQLSDTGTEASIAHLLTLLAEAYAKAGEMECSAEALNHAIHLADKTHSHAYLAEMYRIQGEYHAPNAEKAESQLRKAIDIAQTQNAKLWELRATLSLARRWQAQGRKAEAHTRLASIYAQFTEGFDTPDLTAARTLMKELNTKISLCPHEQPLQEKP